jgi:hypothetical protein
VVVAAAIDGEKIEVVGVCVWVYDEDEIEEVKKREEEGLQWISVSSSSSSLSCEK